MVDCNEELLGRFSTKMNWSTFDSKYQDDVEDTAYNYCSSNNLDTDSESEDMDEARENARSDIIADKGLDISDDYD